MFPLHDVAPAIPIEFLWLQSREHEAYNSNKISCSSVNKVIHFLAAEKLIVPQIVTHSFSVI
jgi:hypothetical protein